ncbi:MAG: DUF115 domain-containing protein [Candidatus Electrothrix sp. AW1]|nr:DUF115 domain-containing protein [Candidatus Electrothrix sp. AX1]MCI5182306.1 DUF115 domain-containing protein [Candidatus Electrothrix gigas]
MKKLLKPLLPPNILESLIQYKILLQQKFKYGDKDFRKNSRLKNSHPNKRCFVICLGESINKQDLTLLENEFVISVSSFFAHKDVKKVKPNYHVLSPTFAYHSKHLIPDTIISWWRAMDEGLDDETIMFMHIGDKVHVEQHNVFKNKKIYWVNYIPWFREDINEIELDRIPSIQSVSEAALSVALYLGFEKIFMLGFDHTWYEKHENYFDPNALKKLFKKYPREIWQECKVDSEHQMRRHAKMFKKYKKLYHMKQNIFNANANENTYVDTFPKVKYEDLFQERE